MLFNSTNNFTPSFGFFAKAFGRNTETPMNPVVVNPQKAATETSAAIKDEYIPHNGSAVIHLGDSSKNVVDRGGFQINKEQLKNFQAKMANQQDETPERQAEKGFSLTADAEGNFVFNLMDGLVDGKTGKRVELFSRDTGSRTNGEPVSNANEAISNFLNYVDPEKFTGKNGYAELNDYLTNLVKDIRNGSATYSDVQTQVSFVGDKDEPGYVAIGSFKLYSNAELQQGGNARQAAAGLETQTLDVSEPRIGDAKPTGVRGFADDFIVRNSALSPEAQENLKTQMADIVAIHRFEQANNFSFNSDPSTPEEKQNYNEMLRRLISEGNVKGSPLYGFRSSLNQIEGSDWKIADGAERLVGHDVLKLYETNKATSDSFSNKYGAVNPRINEYGFAVDMPGVYKDLSYMMTTLQSPDGKTTKAPMLGLDAGQTYSPEINYTDALGLAGMSLEDRKMFLTMAQKILDDVAPGLDVRQLKFTTGYLNEKDMKNNIRSLTLDVAGGPIAEQREAIEQALNTNRTLFAMKEKADYANNKGLGELTISVLDGSGSALAKDQVRLIAGGRSVITTVDTIKEMDQQQMLNFVRASGK